MHEAVRVHRTNTGVHIGDGGHIGKDARGQRAVRSAGEQKGNISCLIRRQNLSNQEYPARYVVDLNGARDGIEPPTLRFSD
jgi:hypothetical protein